MNGCSPIVAIVSPFNTTVPWVSGTVITRPATGASTSAFIKVLLCHRAFGSACAQRGGGDLDRGMRLIHRGPRPNTLVEQRFGARQIGLPPGQAAIAGRRSAHRAN